MKKSLFAIAAVTAFAGAAQAQSSVTVYGILDVGYVGGNAKATTINGTGGQVTPQENFSQFGQSAQTTSRLGFRGTEDLGGGLSALFTFETGLSPNSSTLSAFNNRQAFVGLAQKGMGNARIGTQYTPIHEAVGATGANQQNNLVGDVIYPQNTGLTNRDGSASNANAGYTVRANNMIRFQTESMAGFSVKAFAVQNGRDENQTSYAANNTTSTSTAQRYTTGLGYTGGNTNQNGFGFGLDYTWKKLLVSANYQSFTNENAWTSQANLVPVGTATAVNSATVGIAVNSVAAAAGRLSNTKDNQMYAGATYDFGILKAYAQYIDRKVTSGLDGNVYGKRSAQQIGVRSFVTPKVELWASGGLGRNQTFGSSNPTQNFTGYQVGANYLLSKRTNLYGIFGATNTSTASGQVELSNGSTSATRSFSSNANNYGVGVRHTF
jgi:predicted porin